ncbi:hypothetical protein RRG08_054255 [Elysia crispata]|uniref:Uncharacterized protein n=1 Tax=Elysia crispata TaxID=231223 RepID=A0AAE1CWL9_9GAST|nr:hypothetical protein RRG08_054255 [Elysia crispata]
MTRPQKFKFRSTKLSSGACLVPGIGQDQRLEQRKLFDELLRTGQSACSRCLRGLKPMLSGKESCVAEISNSVGEGILEGDKGDSDRLRDGLSVDHRVLDSRYPHTALHLNHGGPQDLPQVHFFSVVKLFTKPRSSGQTVSSDQIKSPTPAYSFVTRNTLCDAAMRGQSPRAVISVVDIC